MYKILFDIFVMDCIKIDKYANVIGPYAIQYRIYTAGS